MLNASDFKEGDLPCTGDEHKRRRDSSLSHTKEEPHSDQAPIVAADRCKCHDNTPEEGICNEVFRYGKPGDEVRGWVLPEEVSEVKHTGHP
jgi:hypothetical protein